MLIILTVRSARLGKSPKSDILFHLSTSGGLSGVRKESEVLLLELQTINRWSCTIMEKAPTAFTMLYWR